MSRDSSTADRIFEILKERGMSQVELSKRTGIPTSTICDWKRKGNTPTAEKIALVAKALQVSPEEILSYSNGNVSEHRIIHKSDPLWDIVDIYDKSDVSRKERLLKYFNAFLEIEN